jgi:hypothetical protein
MSSLLVNVYNFNTVFNTMYVIELTKNYTSLMAEQLSKNFSIHVHRIFRPKYCPHLQGESHFL